MDAGIHSARRDRCGAEKKSKKELKFSGILPKNNSGNYGASNDTITVTVRKGKLRRGHMEVNQTQGRIV